MNEFEGIKVIIQAIAACFVLFGLVRKSFVGGVKTFDIVIALCLIGIICYMVESPMSSIELGKILVEALIELIKNIAN